MQTMYIYPHLTPVTYNNFYWPLSDHTYFLNRHVQTSHEWEVNMHILKNMGVQFVIT